MLKFGICEARHDTAGQRLWRRGMMSASLLSIGNPASDEERLRFERLMRQVCLSNGVARTTNRGRFAALNEKLRQYLNEIFPPGYPLTVADWAVSSGITTIEWFQCLRADYPEVKLTASDKVLYLIEARSAERGETYILEPDGTPIQYIRPPFVVSLVKKQNWIYPVNRVLQERAIRRWQRLAPDFPLAERTNAFVIRRLPLLHPDVMALEGEAFRIREHSVFEPLDDPVDTIRTMNILNRAYFDDAALSRSIDAVGKSLKEGGLWIVGRTVSEAPPRHDATLYRKKPKGWEPLFRAGAGSEIEPLVQAFANKEE